MYEYNNCFARWVQTLGILKKADIESDLFYFFLINKYTTAMATKRGIDGRTFKCDTQAHILCETCLRKKNNLSSGVSN